jgi:hypothetical protein
MFVTLLNAPTVLQSVYNTPIEVWTAKRLKEEVEKRRNIPVQLGSNLAAGPVCDGSRFAREFAFQVRSLREYLDASVTSN